MLNEADTRAKLKMIKNQVRKDHYFQWGLQYYIAGRFSWKAFFHPISGILFHHAIEMFLKGKLLDFYSPEELRHQFVHNLHKLWNEFKKKHKNQTLDKYDPIIQQLNKWDDTKYPPQKGFVMYSDFRKGDKTKMDYPKMKVENQFRINLEEVDELVKTLFSVSEINPNFFKFILVKNEAKEFFKKDNLHLLDIED